MLARTVTALIAIPLYLLCLYVGGLPWAGLIVFLALLGAWEMAEAFKRQHDDHRPSKSLILIGVVYFSVIAYIPSSADRSLWTAGFVGLLFAAAIRELMLPRRRPIWGVGTTLFASVYPGLLFAHLISLRQLEHDFVLTLFVTLATWASDTAAYFVGSALGKHKLFPSVSPNKTWEGAIGGVVGSMAIGIAMAPYVSLPYVGGALFGAVVAVAGQFGDLFASSVKREAGIDDFGTVFPGHGGVIDRFDSLLLSSTALYYAVLLTRGWPMG